MDMAGTGTSDADQLAKLADLHTSGKIDDAEYARRLYAGTHVTVLPVRTPVNVNTASADHACDVTPYVGPGAFFVPGGPIEQALAECGVSASVIGHVNEQAGLQCLKPEGDVLVLHRTGYQHFGARDVH